MSKKQKKIIFFIEAVSFAHMTRSIALANKLFAMGHKIIIACSLAELEKIPKDSLNEDLTYINLISVKPEKFKNFLEWGTSFITYDLVKKSIIEENNIIDEYKPDLIIGDFRLSLSVSSVKNKIPYINICNAYWIDKTDLYKEIIPITGYEKLIGKTLSHLGVKIGIKRSINSIIENYNRILIENSLDPFNSINSLYTSGDYRFFADIKDFYLNLHQENNSYFAGPLLYQSNTPLPEIIPKLHKKSNPKVLLAFGSTGDLKLFNYLIKKVLPELNYNFIIVSPRYIEKQTIISDNICVVPFLNLDEVSKYIDIAVTNGGSGTTYHMLLRGIPVLSICKNIDQFLFSSYVSSNKLGLMMRAETGCKKEFESNIKSLLEDRIFKENIAKTEFNDDLKEIEILLENIL